MGWYLRKSVKVGPFLRLNLSKSGVGASVGVKGARVGSGPGGNYVHLGRNGIYYRANLPNNVPQAKSLDAPRPSGPIVTQLETASKLVQSGSDEVDRSVSEQIRRAGEATERGDWPAAFTLCDWLIKHAPGIMSSEALVGCYLDRGSALKEMGRLEDALRDYDTAAGLNPSSWMPHYNAGILYVEKHKQYKRAIEFFDAAIELNPTCREALRSRGAAKARVGDLAGAKLDYQDVSSIEPAHVDDVFGVGTACLHLGELANAVKFLEQAHSLSPDDQMISVYYALALHRVCAIASQKGVALELIEEKWALALLLSSPELRFSFKVALALWKTDGPGYRPAVKVIAGCIVALLVILVARIAAS